MWLFYHFLIVFVPSTSSSIHTGCNVGSFTELCPKSLLKGHNCAPGVGWEWPMLHCKLWGEVQLIKGFGNLKNIIQEVKLRSFSTAVHKVEAAVCYKAEMWWILILGLNSGVLFASLWKPGHCNCPLMELTCNTFPPRGGYLTYSVKRLWCSIFLLKGQYFSCLKLWSSKHKCDIVG